MGYTWGYIKKAALAKLDLSNEEAVTLGWLNRFTTYANEVITQVCSTIKPKPSYFTFTCTEEQFVNGIYTIDVTKTNKDFISFGSGQNTVTESWFDIYTQKQVVVTKPATNEFCWTRGYDTVVVTKPGSYSISYNARWIDFATILDNLADTTFLDVPNDILDCIPSYIAAQCYGIDDEYKAAKYRNEFEMLFARIDAKPADGSTEFHIRSDW